MKTLLQRGFRWISQLGSDPNDSADIRLQKSLLIICSFPFVFAGLGWGLMYIFFGARLAGFIPLSYSVVSCISIVYFALTRRFRVFRFSQLLLILLLPFGLMLALGGFVSGSAVILWGLISPLGSMLFDTPKNAPRWFFAYFVLVVSAGILQSYLPVNEVLSQEKILMFFVINISAVGALIFYMVFHFVGEKNLFQARSESLLLNILPKEIVGILRENQRTIAEQFENASILFADIVNFTPLSSKLKPAALVDLLNEVFSKFDSLTEKYGLEKIKTIGDCYMVASGVPKARPDHAEALTHMAVEMQEMVKDNTFNGHRLEFRIGINSGPVIAGVIGFKKFSYDLWGDSVNIASRMESHGSHGAIQISNTTYELIKHDFDCESHGTVNVKGKGDMEVWFVTGKKKKIAKENISLPV